MDGYLNEFVCSANFCVTTIYIYIYIHRHANGKILYFLKIYVQGAQFGAASMRRTATF